jgi:hypothetical protein
MNLIFMSMLLCWRINIDVGHTERTGSHGGITVHGEGRSHYAADGEREREVVGERKRVDKIAVEGFSERQRYMYEEAKTH